MSERNANTPRTATIENPMIVTSSFLCFLLKHELQIGFARSDEKYIHEPHMKYDLEALADRSSAGFAQVDVARSAPGHQLQRGFFLATGALQFTCCWHVGTSASQGLECFANTTNQRVALPFAPRLAFGLRTGAHWASVSHTTRLLFTNRWNGHATSLHHR